MVAVIALSGGMDSATLIPIAKEKGYDPIYTIGFDYGSKHNSYELDCASRIAYHYHLPFHVVDLKPVGEILNSDLLKSGGTIPEGHYEDPIMKATVVPGRNLIMASVLIGHLQSRINAGDRLEPGKAFGAPGGPKGTMGREGVIMMGAHRGDYAIYPDCRNRFFQNLQGTANASWGGPFIRVEVPFIQSDKVGILEYGFKHNVPYHLTRTCYADQLIACGKCGSCQERREAFAKVGKTDPLEYGYYGTDPGDPKGDISVQY